ncbi:MAG: acyltransferase [Oxalobacteraceae bacterium]
MTPTSITPYFILTALFIGVASVIVRWSSFYRDKLTVGPDNRYMAIDGLRGFLALGVFFHHALINYNYQIDHVWKVPDSRFYTMCGEVGVSFFFIITAFLFWSKILNSKGSIDWNRLYFSRIKRIVPLYALSVILIFIMVAIKSRWQFQSLPEELATDVLKWFLFSFFGSPDINKVSQTFTINAGVFWTLQYEWKFYLMLPLMALLFHLRQQIALYLIGFILVILSGEQFLYYFIGGMLAAHLHHKGALPKRIPKIVYDLVFLILLAILFLKFDTAYGFGQAAIASLGFASLLAGNGLFGLLHLKSTRLLGEISYSIYLMHGLILTFMIGFLVRILNVLPAGQNYWLMTGVIGICLILVSSTSYRFVEHRFLQKNKMIT